MKRIGAFFSITKYRIFIVGMLCGMLLLCFITTGVALSNVDVLGEWYMTGIIQEGMTLPVSDPEIGLTFTFHNDATCDLNFFQGDDSSPANGSWSISNNRIEIYGNNVTIYADFIDGKLKMNFNGTPIILEREKPSIIGSTIVDAKSREDFDGFWELNAMESQKLIYPLDELRKTNHDIENYISIASGKVHVIIKDGGYFNEIDYDAFFMSGKLYLSQDGTQVSLIQLREDGQIIYEYKTADKVFNMILTRSEKEWTAPETITPTAEPEITPTPVPTPEPTPIPNRSIKINTEQNTVEVKKQLKLSATVERTTEDAPNKSTLEWISSNENIAKVSKQGVVTGISTGKATIKCYISDSPEIRCEYNISVIKKATGIKLPTSSINIIAGHTYTIEATILPEDVTDKGLIWISSDPSIATVSMGQSNKTTITARKKLGNCTITAKTKDGSNKSVSVKVHVAPFGVSQSEYIVTSKTGLTIPLQWGADATVSLNNKSKDYFNADWVNHEVFINPKKAGKGYIELSSDSPKEKIRINIIIESSAVYDKNSYPYFGYPNILRNPSSYKGKKGHIYGKVLQVSSDNGKTILRVGTSGYFMSDEVFWVECDSSVFQVNVIENDKITIFGRCMGTQSYTTVLGASITIPSIRAEKIVFGKIK